MVEPGRGAAFLVEPLDDLGVVGLLGREDLERDVAVEPGVERPEDRPHPADADRLLQLEHARSARRPSAEGHRRSVASSTARPVATDDHRRAGRARTVGESSRVHVPRAFGPGASHGPVASGRSEGGGGSGSCIRAVSRILMTGRKSPAEHPCDHARSDRGDAVRKVHAIASNPPRTIVSHSRGCQCAGSRSHRRIALPISESSPVAAAGCGSRT